MRDRAKLILIFFILTAVLCVLAVQASIIDLEGLPDVQLYYLGLLVILVWILLYLIFSEFKSGPVRDFCAFFCGVGICVSTFFYIDQSTGGAFDGYWLVLPPLLLLPLLLVLNSAALTAVYQLLCGLFFMNASVPNARYIYAVLMILLIPYGIMLYSKNDEGKTLRKRVFETGMVLGGYLFLIINSQSSAFGVWLFSLYAFSVALFLIHFRILPVTTPCFLSPVKILALMGILTSWGIGFRSDRWASGIIPSADWMINIEFFIVLLVVCVLLAENILRSRSNIEQLLFCFSLYLSFGVYIYFEFFRPAASVKWMLNLYFYIVVFVACISGIIMAVRRSSQRLLLTWAGVLAVIFVGSFISDDMLFYRIVLAALLLFALSNVVYAVFNHFNQERGRDALRVMEGKSIGE